MAREDYPEYIYVFEPMSIESRLAKVWEIIERGRSGPSIQSSVRRRSSDLDRQHHPEEDGK